MLANFSVSTHIRQLVNNSKKIYISLPLKFYFISVLSIGRSMYNLYEMLCNFLSKEDNSISLVLLWTHLFCLWTLFFDKRNVKSSSTDYKLCSHIVKFFLFVSMINFVFNMITTENTTRYHITLQILWCSFQQCVIGRPIFYTFCHFITSNID